MSRVVYGRAGYHVEIRAAGAGAELRCSWLRDRVALSADELAALRAGQAPAQAAAVFAPAAVRYGLDQTLVADRRLERIELAVAPALADIDWEARCGGAVAVRICNVRAHAAERALHLPLRVLELDPVDRAWSIAQLRDDVFGFHDPELIAQAIRVRQTRRDDIAGFLARVRWPTADLIHVHDATFLNSIADPEATTAPHVVGTLGWFLRLERWQTRLVVLAFPGAPPAAVVRRLAGAAVNRGGPAIVASSASPDAWRRFYDQLIHDAPIDLALAQLPQPMTAAWLGGGREEALRPSNIGAQLVAWAEASHRPEERGPDPEVNQEFRDALRALQDDWPQLTFESHESGGLLPLTRYIQALRSATAGTRSLESARDLEAIAENAPPSSGRRGMDDPVPDPDARHLNATLWRDTGEALRPIAQRGDDVREGERIHLGLDIGPRSVVTAGELPILNDAFTWQDEGTWVELVVTPLDFEVEGHVAQPLWLPRSGASDRVYFAIRAKPAVEGVARIRFGLYHDNNLVQSWLLAVAHRVTSDPPAALRRALGLDADLDGELGELPDDLVFLARPEFSATGVDNAASRPPRTVSVLANDLEGKRHLLIKGTDLATPVDPEGQAVEDAIRDLRAALDRITSEPRLDEHGVPLGPEFIRYRYAHPTRDQLAEDLQTLAHAGWVLYQSVVIDEDADRKLAERLRDPGATIQAIHTNLRKTIPWSLVYDRRFDPDVSRVGNEPTTTATCLAALPDRNGVLGARRCGESERCELHPIRIAERKASGGPIVVDRTVACPLHFWGFAHRVETPPQIVRAATIDAAPAAADAVDNASPTAVGVGYFPFGCWPEHLQQLQDISQVTLQGPHNDRDDVIALLDHQDLDVYYLFCHADGGALRFTANARGADKVTAGDLAIRDWRHRPLAVLNGCGTAGWSPSSIAPLIERFTRKKAGAIIGTEVRVHEALGARIGRELLGGFLAGRPIGDALLTARRKLLSELNPLGLVYTLYGSAELALRTRPAP